MKRAAIDKAKGFSGRLRKKHELDCGNSRCGICHQDKYPKRQKTMQELKADAKQQDINQ